MCLVLPFGEGWRGLSLEGLDALGFVDHPDGSGYADDLLSLNFPLEYKGADHLRIRTFVNQIGQIPIPVARGLGYTILPRSGIEAFPHQEALSIVPLAHKRHQELWLVYRTGRTEFARVASVQRIIMAAAEGLG